MPRGRKKKVTNQEWVEEIPETIDHSAITQTNYLELTGVVPKGNKTNTAWKDLNQLHEREAARQADEGYRRGRVEGDHPRRWMDGMDTGERTVEISRLLLEGYTPKQLVEDFGVNPKEIRPASKATRVNVRMSEVQKAVTANVLKGKRQWLRMISGMSLAGLTEWLVHFMEEKKHLEMSVGEACQFAKFARDMNELRRLEAGKPTNRTELVQKAEQQVEKVIEVIARDEIDDPFAAYGRKTSENGGNGSEH